MTRVNKKKTVAAKVVPKVTPVVPKEYQKRAPTLTFEEQVIILVVANYYLLLTN